MQRSDTQVSFVVEDDEDTWGSGDTERRAFFSACITLTLGVLGSSILPIPFAISKTGVLVGVLTMLLVAWANDATSCMLIRAAAATGKPTYEALAEWAGGRPWKVFTQISLVLLLWGTMCGGLCLISDVGHMLLQRLGEGQLPGWVNGRSCMAAVALLVLFPLCLQRHMRELEKAATAGVVVVAGLIALLATDTFQEGFPAIQDGQLPLWSLKVDSHLPEAFAVVGYAFYMQPMMMPLLREMPEGQHGVRIMQRAVHATLFGVALTVYFSMGLFGASLFGQDTEGNIMVNELVAGRAAVAALYGIMLLYLALGMTTTQYALRASLDLMVFGEEATFTWRRQVAWTTLTVGSSLTVALAVPDQAEKIYAVVGATAVCVVCYVIPVYIQLQMFRRSKQQRKLQVLEEDHPLAAALLQNAAAPYGADDCEATASAGPSLKTSSSSFCNGFRGIAGRRRLHHAWEVVHEAVLPIAILLIGVGFSVAALYVAVLPLLQQPVNGSRQLLPAVFAVA
uniref:Amino acid transporter transmembrane domain-containing protein n=1 Tax=Tetradesmus obliquus TaxID=3088 RepID=A0A383VGQ9_TETOB|eukprot:jgi/Sobl393_1/2353/SZX64735.1